MEKWEQIYIEMLGRAVAFTRIGVLMRKEVKKSSDYWNGPRTPKGSILLRSNQHYLNTMSSKAISLLNAFPLAAVNRTATSPS